MRIYPFAFRVTSSNLDPSFYWRRGAQLVALNWQNIDKGMMLNHGMFAGTPGWQLKPAGYRSSDPCTDTAGQVPRHNVDLTIEVFAGQDLSLPPGDRSEKRFRPYVNCQLHVEEPESPVATGQDDVSSDSEKSSYRLCTRSSSGRDPDFEGQKLVFPTVKGVIEELSFLRFVSLFVLFWDSVPALLAADCLAGNCITAHMWGRSLRPLIFDGHMDKHSTLSRSFLVKPPAKPASLPGEQTWRHRSTSLQQTTPYFVHLHEAELTPPSSQVQNQR